MTMSDLERELLAALEYLLAAQNQPFDHPDRRLSREHARVILAAIAKARKENDDPDSRV